MNKSVGKLRHTENKKKKARKKKKKDLLEQAHFTILFYAFS